MLSELAVVWQMENTQRGGLHMCANSRKDGPSIFISYRIADTLPVADRLAAELQRTFGAEAVFFDHRTIEPGEPWDSTLEGAVKGAAVVLVLIGEKWLTEQNDYGRRRLDVKGDWVRREVETTLLHAGSVIPVLVDNASPLPKEALDDLPSIVEVSGLQATPLRTRDWDGDFRALVEKLTGLGLRPLPAGDVSARPSSRPATPGPGFDLGEKQRVLNTDQFPRNKRRFDELKRVCQRGFVIPFVGAGMSKSAGCPEWEEHLLNLCPEAGLDQDAMRQRLEERCDYEGVMHDLVTKLGETRFNLDFERDFKPNDDFAGAIIRLPKLFNCAAITTNFDRVLEMAYERSDKAFVEKTTGRGPVNAFYRALPAGERYLLKLHGSLDNAAERVLNKSDYDDAYGNDGNIHFDRPVPKLLKRLYTSFSFLFLACSLSYDCTIQTFAKIAQHVGADSLPHHYTILGCPSDTAQKDKLEQRLADAHISAIWYPKGEHNHVEELLEFLTY